MRKIHVIRFGAVGAVALLLLAVFTYTTFFAAAQNGTRIQYGDSVTGEISAVAATDRWAFDGLRDDIITVHMARTSGQLIPRIEVHDSDGLLLTLIAQQTVTPTVEVTISLRSSGPHTLIVGSDGSTTGTYQLDLALLESGAPPTSDDGTLVYGRTGTSAIDDATFREFWSFQGVGGDVVDVQMVALSGDLDAYVSLLSPQGDVLASSDAGGQGLDAAVYAIQLPTTGTYSVVARRAGPNFGEQGRTAGDYDLLVTLRSSGNPDGNPAPTVLAIGRLMRGRLNANAPAVLYSIESEGVLALRLDLAQPTQLGTVTVMTPERAVLGTFTGINPVQGSVVLPNAGEYWVEVSAARIRENEPVDFGLVVTLLQTTTRTARPLIYNSPQVVSADNAGSDAWYFTGTAGDLIAVTLEPFGTALTGSLTIVAPDGTPLLQRPIEGATVQSLQLPSDGLYEVLLESDELSTGYSIDVTQIGMGGVAFAQYTNPRTENVLPVGAANAVTGALDVYATDQWVVDVDSPATWRFTLSASSSPHPLVIALESPEGAWVGQAVTDEFTRTARLQARLPHAGRYRVLVLNLHDTDVPAYSLAGLPVEGAVFSANTTIKGVLTTEFPYDVWTLSAAPNNLINIHLDLITPSSPPDIHVIGPDGLLVASTALNEQPLADALIGVPTNEGGAFRVIVQQPIASPRLVYTIAANVVSPFDNTSLTTPLVEATVPGVFVTAATSTLQPVSVSPSDLITPALAADAPVLADASRIEVETLIRGDIEAGARFQAWTIAANADQLLGFYVIALDGDDGPDLIIQGQDGNVVADKYVTDTTTNTLMHRFAAGGTYTVAVKLDQGGRYVLWVDVLNRIDEQVATVLPGKAFAYGQTQIDQLVTPGDVRSFLFFGYAGDVIALRAVAQENDLNLQLVLTAPDGTVLGDIESDTGPHAVLSDIKLSSDGIYQIDISRPAAAAAAVGQFTLHLNLQKAQPATRRGGGVLDTEQTVVLAPNTTHQWLFTAHVGERVSLRVEPLDSGAPTPLTLQLADSAGRVFLQQESQLGQGALVLDDVLLPRTGVYLALVSGAQQGGTYRIVLTHDRDGTQDVERAIRYGETVGKVFAAPNFLDVWTFAGSRGDVVTVAVRPVRGDALSLSLQVRTGDGGELATVISDGTRSGVRTENITLPATGHYSLVIGNIDTTFEGATAYDLTLLLRDATARSASSVIDYGDRVRGTFYIDDPTDAWVFEGRQGDVATAVVTTQTPGLFPTVTLLATDWRAASASQQFQVLENTQVAEDASTAQLEFVLPLDGTYALIVNDGALYGGTYDLELIDQNETTIPATALRLDQLRDGQIAPGDLSDSWRFDGLAGTTVTIRVAPDSRANLSPQITLFSPSGIPLVSSSAGSGDEAVISAYKLPERGSYVVRVAPTLEWLNRTEGRYTIQVQESVAPSEDYKALPFETVQSGTLDETTPDEWWEFEGQRGDVVRVRAEATSGDLDVLVRLYGVDNVLIGEADDVMGLDAETYVTLPDDGWYTVEVRRYRGTQGTTSGNYALNLDRVYQNTVSDTVPDVTTMPNLAYGDRVAGSTDGNNRSDFWAFSGVQGDIVQAKIQFAVDDAPLTLTLRDPAGNALVTGERERGNVVFDRFVLPASGPYVLDVRRPGDATARYSPYTLDLSLRGADVSLSAGGGHVELGETTMSRFSHSTEQHTWLFEGQATEMVSVSIIPLNGTFEGHLELRAPDSSPIYVTPINTNITDHATGSMSLPVSGVYTLVVRADHAVPGTVYRIRIQRTVRDTVVQSLAFDADEFGVLGNTQARETWQFSGAAGQIVSVRVSRTSGDLIPVVMLYGPDGRPLGEGRRLGDTQALISRFVLPATGDYTIVVAREGYIAGTTTGTYRVMLRQRAISEYAAAAQDIMFENPVYAFIDRSMPQVYAFEARAGDVIAISAALINGEAVPTLRIESESGATITLPTITESGETRITAFEIPRTGRFVVVVTAQGPAEYALAVHRRPETPGENAIFRTLGRGQTFVEGVQEPTAPTYWQFSGQRGEVLNFTVDTSGGGLRADVTLFGPNGFVANAAETFADDGVVVMGPVRLPDDGDYVLMIGPWLGSVGGSTGRYSVLVDDADPGVSGSMGGHILARGIIATGGLIAVDNTDQWTFDGTAGEVITVRAEHEQTDATLRMTLHDPEGTVVTNSTPATAYPGAEIIAVRLPSTGVYTLSVNGEISEEAAVDYRITVFTAQSPVVASAERAQGLAYGDTVSGTLPTSEDYAAWVFYGTAGEQVQSSVVGTGDTFAPALYLVGPSGSILRAQAMHAPGATATLNNYVLHTTGFFSLVVGGDGQGPFDYTLTLARMPSGTLDQGLLTATGQGILSTVAPIHQWRVQPDHGGTYLVQVHSLTMGVTPQLFIQSASGIVLASGVANGQGVIVAQARLEANTPYAVLVSGGVNPLAAQYDIELAPASVLHDGERLYARQAEVGRITRARFSDEWRFVGQTAQMVTVVVNRIDGDLIPVVALYDPNGLLLREIQADVTGSAALTLELPTDGTYRIVIARANLAAGTTTGDYSIVVGVQ